MGIFSRLRGKANDALDNAIDPEKQIDMAILELEEQRKKALAELVAFKVTAKQMEKDIERQTAKADEWEKRAIAAVSAGDDEAAKEALRQKKACLVEAAKIQRDRDEATGYAVGLNKSRKQFETKLTALKLRKGTLATQIAAGRAGGDLFGNGTDVWDQFKVAEERIDAEAIATEVDAAMRGEELTASEFDQKLAGGSRADEELAAMKERLAEQKSTRRKQLGSASEDSKGDTKKP